MYATILTFYFTVFIFANGEIAFTSNRQGNFDIYVMNRDGQNVHNITKDSVHQLFPSWSSDGEMLAFSSSNIIYIMDVDKKKSKRLIAFFGDMPLCSPDGSKIAFIHNVIRFPKISIELRVVDIDGENEQSLVTLHSISDRPHTWLSDGSRLAFCDGGDIYIIDSNGKNLTKIVPQGKNLTALNIDCSIDNKLAISASDVGREGIYTMNLDGSGVERISKGRDRAPEWSPDGLEIALASFRDGNWDIYVMDADGRNVRGLTENESFDFSPSWVWHSDFSVNCHTLATTWISIKTQD